MLEKAVAVHDRGVAVLLSLNNVVQIWPSPGSALAKFGSVLVGTGNDAVIHFTTSVTTTYLSE